MNCPHDAAGIEAYPYFGIPGAVDTLDEKGAGIINASVSECRSLLNSKYWQRWWRWRVYVVWSSFKLATGNTLVHLTTFRPRTIQYLSASVSPIMCIMHGQVMLRTPDVSFQTEDSHCRVDLHIATLHFRREIGQNVAARSLTQLTTHQRLRFLKPV